MIRKATNDRLSRLEAVAKVAPIREIDTPRLAHELWFLVLTGHIRVDTSGMWCLPVLFGQPASIVPQELVDLLNRPGPMRQLAEELAASPDGRYTVTDDEGREFSHELIPAGDQGTIKE